MNYLDLPDVERQAWERKGGKTVFDNQSKADTLYQRFAKSLSGNRPLVYSEAAFPGYYGGAYMNSKGNLVVLIQNDTTANKNDFYERIESNEVEFIRCQHSFKELISTQAKLMSIKPDRAKYSDSFADNFVGCELRDSENCLYVMLKHISDNTEVEFLRNGFDTAGLKFVQRQAVPEDCATNITCGSHAPYGSSMGYRARKNGNDGFVTTAHGVPSSIGSSVNASDNLSVIGTVQGWNYGLAVDGAFIQTNSNYTPSNTISSGGTLGTTLWEPVAGAQIYAVGRISGLRSGTVLSTSYAYYDTNNVGWVLVSSNDLGGQTGDSGGLVYRVISDGYYAAGIYKGTSKDQYDVFSKASSINSYLSLTRY